VCHGVAKFLARHPDKDMGIRRKVRGFWIRLGAIKHIRNRLPLIWRQWLIIMCSLRPILD
jgi:hypothetical protein